MHKCLNCPQELTSPRAKFCSAECKSLYRTKKKYEPDKVTVPDSRTSEPDKVPGVGFCHGCKKQVPEIVCICSDCISKGITHLSLGLDISKCTSEKVSSKDCYFIHDIDDKDCKELLADYSKENKIKFLKKYGGRNYVIGFGKDQVLHVTVPEVDLENPCVPNWMKKRPALV